MTTFLDDLTDLVDPIAGDPLLSSNGKAQTAYQKAVNDAVEDIRLSLVGKPFRSAKAFSPVATSVLDAGDALTNWVGVNSSPTIDTAIKTTGTGSVKAKMKLNNVNSKEYLNVPGAPSTTGKIRVMIDLRYLGDGSTAANLKLADTFELFVASGAGMTGTVVAIPIPFFTAENWLAIPISVAGVATLGSVGIRHKGSSFLNSASDDMLVWLDNVRWEATELDVAIASANAVMVPADYTSAVPQSLVDVPAGKTVIDLRPGYASITRSGGVRYGPEFGLVPDTGLDITGLLSYILGQIPVGGALVLAPGQYRMDGQVDVFRFRNIELRAYGVRFYRTVQNANGKFFNIRSGQQINIFGPMLFGFRTTLTNGSALTSVASNRLSNQQSDREDASPSAEALLWTAMDAGTNLGNNTKFAKRPKGVSYQVNNKAVGGTATIGMKLPGGASAPIDVEPSVAYTLFGSFRPVDQPATYNAWAARTCEVVTFWWKADGTAASTPSSSISGVEIDQNTWKLVSGSVSSPADAARASLECHILGAAGTSGGLSGEAHMIDLIGIQRTTARVLGTSGTTMLLVNPGDEARLGTARVYARDKDLQTKCDFILSDNNHVANDCELLIRDDETGEVLASRVIAALDGTPTTYQSAYTGNNWSDMANDLARLVRFSVRKVKTTANTIIVTSATEYGSNAYDASTESGHGIVVSDTDPDSGDIRIEDVWVEGVSGDAISFTSGGNRCVGRRVVSRSCGRQGFSQTGGADNGFENADSIGSGRSAMDWEPPTGGRIMRRPFLHHFRAFRPTNAGMAWGPWAISEFANIDDVFIWKAGVQSNFGGKWSTVSNVISVAPTHASNAKDVKLTGLGSVFTNFVVEYGWDLDNTAKGYIDDNGNSIQVPSAGNRVNGMVVRTGGAGIALVGDHFTDPASSRGIETAITPGVTTFTVTIPAQFDTTFAVFLEFNWLTTWRITARTTTSFTVEVGTVVPASPSVHWMTAGP